MKYVKWLGKITLTVVALAYGLCLYQGDPLLEYTTTDRSVILSVVGGEVEINTQAAIALKEKYAKAEEEAGKCLPPKIKNVIRGISRFLR